MEKQRSEEKRGAARSSEEKRGEARRSEEERGEEREECEEDRKVQEAREEEEEKERKELEERERKLEEDREAAESWLEEIRRQQRETRGRLKEMRRKFELKEAVTTATERSDDEEASKCEVYQKAARQSWSWCRGGKANEQKRKDRMGWYSVSASEEEDGGREASVVIPPGIMVERERNEKEDAERSDKLVARVQKLEEQMRWMHHKMLEATSFTGAFTENESASWRREGAGGEWQRWKGAWWVKVEQQNLNSRQRRQISRGLRRLIARGREETIGVLEELKHEIRTEWVKANARSTGAQRCKSSSEEECLEAMALRQSDGKPRLKSRETEPLKI